MKNRCGLLKADAKNAKANMTMLCQHLIEIINMNKPKLIDYVEVPKSTTTETHYNYKRYSIALENYIKHLEAVLKKSLKNLT